MRVENSCLDKVVSPPCNHPSSITPRYPKKIPRKTKKDFTKDYHNISLLSQAN